MIKPAVKIVIQHGGRFLSNMILPNIGAFIIWGFITALFIPTGWLPNEQLAKLIQPMILYFLPVLIGYTGGKLVAGERGAVVGAATTMGAVVATEVPMFIGAMIVGPLAGLAIKHVDNYLAGKIKSGFEMLVNNLTAGIVGMITTILAFYLVGPFVQMLSGFLTMAVSMLVDAGLLPLTSIFVEPAKVLFLNNAINHGILSPLGIQQSFDQGQSIFFLIEANPGPGLGILLAYIVFGNRHSSRSGGGAAIIHFFGGIHEVYFPYVFMNPRLILALIAGGMTGVFILGFFDAGLVAPASPGSIFSVMLMTSKTSLIGVPLAIAASTVVSFIIASILLKAQGQGQQIEE